jgi:Ca2+-binding EF-hand superfamily protein
MAAVKENTDAFVKLDSDKDGTLSEDEFTKVAQSLQPPLTKEEFDFVVAGLDRDGDGALSPHEFHAYGMNSFSEADATTPDAATHVDAKHATSTSPTPEAVKHGSDQGSQVTMEEFQRSMGPVAPDEAFDFIDADHDNNINLADLRQSGRAFTPPLGGKRAEFAFHGLDRDGSDKVTKKEFVDAINAGSFAQGEKPGAPNASTTEPAASTTSTTAKPLQRKMMTGSGSPITIPEFLDRLAAADSSATQPLDAVGVGQRDLHDDHPHVPFAALDGDGDGAMLPQELGASKGAFNPPLSDLEAAGAFNDLDVNHDGQVTAAEFDDAVAKAGKHGGSARSVDQAMDDNAQIAFGDGRFLVSGGKNASESQPEFTLADFVERSKTAFGSPEAAFSNLDTGGDGASDFQEFVKGVQKLEPPLSDMQAAVAFKGLDLDQDGMVSAEEYAKAAAQSPAPEDELTMAKFKERMGAASPDLVFQTMDADGDDGVTLDEMMTARSAFSPQLSESQAKHAFAGLDGDGDLVVR